MKNLALTLALTAAISCGNEKAQQNTQPDQTNEKSKAEQMVLDSIKNHNTRLAFVLTTQEIPYIQGENGEVIQLPNTKIKDDTLYNTQYYLGKGFQTHAVRKATDQDIAKAEQKAQAEIQKKADAEAERKILIKKHNLIDPSKRIRARRILTIDDQRKFAPSLNINRAETDELPREIQQELEMNRINEIMEWESPDKKTKRAKPLDTDKQINNEDPL